MTDQARKYRLVTPPEPEDTTRSDATDLLTPGFLRFVGELLYGPRWQTPLAQHLGTVRGRPLAPATVHRWSTETRSIPDWVADALASSLEAAQLDLGRRAKETGDLARRLRAVRQGAMPPREAAE